MTFDYFIAWGWAQKDGGSTEWSPYMAACLYARYDKGLKVNVKDDGTVEEDSIKIDGVEGISCEGCKVDMSVDAQLALFVEVNTDHDNETPDLNDLYTNFEVWTCVEIKILRRVRPESSRRPPRHRRDACSMAWRCRFLAARPSQDGRIIAKK